MSLIGVRKVLILSEGQSLFQKVVALNPLAIFDISQLDTLFSDRSSTPSTPAVVDGVVGTIKDLSGNSNHVIASSDAARGILRTDGTYYWIETDGVNDIYVANVSTGAISLGILCCAASITPSGNDEMFAFGNSSNGDPLFYLNQTTTTVQTGWRSDLGVSANATWTQALSGDHIYTNVIDTTTMLRVDGVERANTGSPAVATFDRLAVGGLMRSSPANFANGKFYGGVAFTGYAPDVATCEAWVETLSLASL